MGGASSGFIPSIEEATRRHRLHSTSALVACTSQNERRRGRPAASSSPRHRATAPSAGTAGPPRRRDRDPTPGRPRHVRLLPTHLPARCTSRALGGFRGPCQPLRPGLVRRPRSSSAAQRRSRRRRGGLNDFDQPRVAVPPVPAADGRASIGHLVVRSRPRRRPVARERRAPSGGAARRRAERCDVAYVGTSHLDCHLDDRLHLTPAGHAAFAYFVAAALP